MASVLIVDDEMAIRDVLRRVAESGGHTVRTAANAHQALELLRESHANVVMTDVHMTGPNGLWLADHIREQFPESAVVLATADATIPSLEKLRRGIVGYIVKPFQRAQVLAAIEEGVRWAASARNLQDR
jgi:two-component system response regulator GlrR